MVGHERYFLNRILNRILKNPIYLRYINDIIILANNNNEINILQHTFEINSDLNFTHELNKNNKIPFCDILIDTNNNNNITNATYKKKRPVISPVPSTLKVPPKQYFIKR